ncbi:MAG: chlorophyll synthase ChlG [Chlorobium sp.]|jgi:chlorophyll synthase|uniref:chlorophyll synthase ChlG n=1 Tax=Chlorobium sp. TaxID=1095 RepID=UPI0025C7340E|nr:chlorophyll synthase ChlG [Chlorobium sp.]MCF8215911.1 chlorophyll synthase ChlG [Chlorobium sp.]MCF8270809.1 chlorophyll synthase ChlG [Chlorobium sp.]MCF8287121.1 chlorophyll synthase ChlG [Chlorobium sp.]MCF8290778.1 chlorophyll synthase ChlG [Chlorobium sp.]MCF8384882.1 chlorophyll synthase ChlG [Chlorobium sp.]
MNGNNTLHPGIQDSISDKLRMSGVSASRQKAIQQALENVNKPGFRIEPSAILPLMKPVTWFPPMWAFACGVVSTGEDILSNWSILLRGVILAGPLMCAMSQTMNDYFDREVDAINEPDRPIPAGKISKSASWLITFGLIITGFLVALSIHPYVVAIAFVGVLMSHAYSGPPIRAKRNGWFGNLIVGLAYEGVAWLTGSFAITQGVPSGETIALAIIFSLGAHGIMTLNDFKSVVGDNIRKVASIPVQLGEKKAAILASVIMDLAQIAAISILVVKGAWVTTSLSAVLLLAQLPMQKILIANPREKAVWYNAFGTLLYVLSMMVCAVGIRP